MADKYLCYECSKPVTGTKNDRYRTHTNGEGAPCGSSSTEIPEHVLANPVTADDRPDVPKEGLDFAVCPQCGRKVKLTRLGYFQNHDQTLRGADRCPVSGVRAKHARAVEDHELPQKPIDESVRPVVKSEERRPVAELTAAPDAPTPGAREGASETTSEDSPTPSSGPVAAPLPETGEKSQSPESTSTPPSSERPSSASSEPTSSDAPGSPEESAAADEGPPVLHLAPLLDDVILQPFSHILQPFPVPVRVKMADSMSERGKEIAARLRETFYAYTNRNSKDNRSAQTTLGPSEAGSPCDRQIAMKLMGIAPVNPQEGWAPFVGTAVHVELAKMFEWANGSGSGRYVTEMPLSFGSAVVPRGTSDLLDRVLFMIMDHKLMGRWSLDKLIQNGPSETYRIQGQIYALGAVLAGEKVREVAIIAWPRQESSLDKLYVHVEKFDRKVAEAALRRVERIAADVRVKGAPLHPDGQWSAARPLEVAQEFEAGDDCKWCPFYLKGDKKFDRGCPGK